MNNKELKRCICLNKAIDDVVDFNAKAGNNLDDVMYDDLFNQTKITLEECNELMVAAGTYVSLRDGKITPEQVYEVTGDLNYDAELEVLDGMCDVLVTALQAVAQLEALGFNVADAFDRVMENNNTKIFDDHVTATQAAVKLQEKLGVVISLQEDEYEGVKYWTMRDVNNKIRKPVDFVGVDISEFLPSYLEQKSKTTH
jgi:hypothetical protein